MAIWYAIMNIAGVDAQIIHFDANPDSDMERLDELKSNNSHTNWPQQ